MKLTVLQENLQQTLSILAKAIPTKPSLPILSSVQLSATNSLCAARATDLYFGVETIMAAQVDREGVVVVPGKQFREIISTLSPGPVELSFAEGTLSIQSGKSKTTLQCQSADEYPPFPEVAGSTMSIATTVLTQIDSLVAFAASTDIARPVLTSILLDMRETGLRAVATDGFRLAVLDCGDGFSVENEMAVLLPAKAISEIARLAVQLSVDEVVCTISQELKQIKVVVADVSVYIRLIEGQYPPYEKIIPVTTSTTIVFDVGELQNHVKRALVFARESSNIIKFSATPNSVELTATSALVGTYQGVLEHAKFEGENIEIAFNVKYIQDFLAAVKSDTIQVSMTESLKPVKFVCEQLPGYQYVVMPFKVA